VPEGVVLVEMVLNLAEEDKMDLEDTLVKVVRPILLVVEIVDFILTVMVEVLQGVPILR